MWFTLVSGGYKWVVWWGRRSRQETATRNPWENFNSFAINPLTFQVNQDTAIWEGACPAYISLQAVYHKSLGEGI